MLVLWQEDKCKLPYEHLWFGAKLSVIVHLLSRANPRI